MPYEYIWQRLREVWNVELTESTRRAHAPRASTTPVTCLACGLERFEPVCAGNADFYEQLMAIVPYNADRWEFRIVRELLSDQDAVLDIGCGNGAFLRGLGPRPGRTAGIDHHGPSIERLASAGIEAYTADITSFAPSEAGAFDAATCFHVLEHVRDPLATVRAARACLRPDGRLFVSLPNRRRALRGPDEPLDLPPHHVTRWEAEQLRVLAARAGFRVRRLHFEPPEFSVVRAMAKRAAARRLTGTPDPLATFCAKLWAHAAVGPARYQRSVRTGRYVRQGIFGHSMMAELVADGMLQR